VLPPWEVDPGSGYRSYHESQLDDAILIRDLRQAGLSLAEVSQFQAADSSTRRDLLDRRLAATSRSLAEARAAALRVLNHVFPTETPMTTITIPAAALRQALDQVLPAAGGDLERPVLTCVLLEAKDGSLRLVATDSYRLVVRDLAAHGDAGFRALIPAATLRRWHDALPVDGEGTIGLQDESVVIRSGELELLPGLRGAPDPRA
jgi:DNA-binding transcriptional MerR regulator